jgi:hypothetical protein
MDESERFIRAESDFEDGLDFYQISFDEVDGKHGRQILVETRS